jgi:hypothetical protein
MAMLKLAKLLQELVITLPELLNSTQWSNLLSCPAFDICSILELLKLGNSQCFNVHSIFWILSPCRLVGRYRHLRGTWCLHLQGWSVERRIGLVM